MRVVIADDAPLVRLGMASLLKDEGFDVIATVDDGEAIVRTVESLAPDVAIVDIRMPPTYTDEGLRAAAAIHAVRPTVGVLVLSQYVEADYALDLISGRTSGTGGAGYLLKDRVASAGALADAVRRVGRGDAVIDPELVSLLMRDRRRAEPLDRLTDRERTILAHMAEGRSNEAIARLTSVARKTVEAHVSSIFTKLDLEPAPDDNRRVLAVLAYLRCRTTGAPP